MQVVGEAKSRDGKSTIRGKKNVKRIKEERKTWQ